MCDSDKFAVDNTSVKNKVKHFEDNVLFNPANKGKMVYILFKADWCGACKAYKPVFLKYRDICRLNKKDDMVIVVVDVDTAQDLSNEYQVEGLPTTYVYKVDDHLLANRHKKLELYKEKIVGSDTGALARIMKKYHGLSL